MALADTDGGLASEEVRIEPRFVRQLGVTLNIFGEGGHRGVIVLSENEARTLIQKMQEALPHGA